MHGNLEGFPLNRVLFLGWCLCIYIYIMTPDMSPVWSKTHFLPALCFQAPHCHDIVRHFMSFLTLLDSSVEQHVPLSKLYPKRNLLQLKQFMSPLKFGKCIIFHQTSHWSQESYTAYASPMLSFPLSRKFMADLVFASTILDSHEIS